MLRKLISLFRVPLTRAYLQKERAYQYKDILVTVKPGVFHPGLFPSTQMILNHLTQQELSRKTLLELGCGAGLISVYAAKAGAIVTASDISVMAIENTQINISGNNSRLTVIHSNLFEKIPRQSFDWIVINPPYYARNPATEAEAAWYCGKNFEYFRKLFPSLKNFISPESHIIMTLTKDSEVNTIEVLANESGFKFNKLEEKNTLLEGTDYLFQVIQQ